MEHRVQLNDNELALIMIALARMPDLGINDRLIKQFKKYYPQLRKHEFPLQRAERTSRSGQP